ncbi:hypothetical protein AX15_003059 [Amanita polypyramis BW_CC]|nr:hypothetical protein AX15_003059 [Amanita polypyramis BW_CC]
MTSVSPHSPARYHIEDQDNAVHVFLNCPLSRLDLWTLKEILHHAEKPCHSTRMPISAPPSPNTGATPSSPGPSTYMKFSKSLFSRTFGASSQSQGASSSDQAQPRAQQCHQTHEGEGLRPIHFYDKDKPHYGFTNFSEHPIKYRGQMYPTSEHLFQSLKFLDHKSDVAEMIRVASRPRDAFDLARQYRKSMRNDWFQVNIKMMDDVLWHKFMQHKALKNELLATGNAELIEAGGLNFWKWIEMANRCFSE